MTSIIRRKFYFRGTERWFLYFVNDRLIADVRDELDLREIA